MLAPPAMYRLTVWEMAVGCDRGPASLSTGERLMASIARSALRSRGRLEHERHHEDAGIQLHG